MSTPNTTGASVEDMDAVRGIIGDWDYSGLTVESLARLLSRARDEARREALEEDRRAPSPAVKALVEACRAIKDYERSGAVPFLEWDRYYDAMHEALAAVEREIGGA